MPKGLGKRGRGVIPRPPVTVEEVVEATLFDPNLVKPPGQPQILNLKTAMSPAVPSHITRVTTMLQFPNLPNAPGPIEVEALVDTGADVNFIDRDFLILNGVQPLKLKHPIPLAMVDSSRNVSVTHVVRLPVCFDRFKEELTFCVFPLKGYQTILGMPFLKQFDPDLDFRRGCIASFPYTPEEEPPLPEVPAIAFVSARQFRKDLAEAGQYGLLAATATISPTPTTTTTELPAQYADFADVFATAEMRGLPPRRPFDHRIELTDPNAPLPNSKPYKHSPAELEALWEYLNRAQATGEIVRSSSPARSSVLFVKKKDGSLRVCIDYRALNKITKKNRTPLPLIPELLDRLREAKYFARIDLADGYKQLRMAEGSEYLTAFGTRFGSFEYQVMPFGLCNAPATFQSLINTTFHDMVDQFVVAYLDDILIFSRTLEEHEDNVRKVLARLRKEQLYAKLEKCDFLATSVEFLGYIVSADGIAMDPKKIDAILAWPTPRNVKDTLSFLGFCNFYRQFIRNYSGIAAPLTRLTRKDVPFVWDATAEESFQALKHAFTTADILRHCDPRLPYLLETDASDYAYGAVLSQEFEDGLRPVAFYSKKFTPAELNYSIHNKELLSIVRAFEHWRDYLEGAQHKVRVITDHQPLMYFNTKRVLDRQQARWSVSLSRFDFSIEHRPGVKSGKPDALSRRSDHALTDADATEERVLNLFAAQLWQLESLSHETIRLAQQSDDHSRSLADRLRKDTAATGEKDYKLDPKGLIRWRGRLYVPDTGELRLRIMEENHNAPMAGHPGQTGTWELVRRHFYWPGQRVDINRFVGSCPTCARAKHARAKPAGLLKPIPPPERPWETVTLDFITSLPDSNGHTAILVMVDPLSKMAKFEPCGNDIDAPTLAECFVRRVVSQFGIPRALISDRGPQFTSHFWRSLTARLGTSLNLSTAFRPQVDGQTEIVNGWLGQYLRSFSCYQQDDWCDLLPLAEFAYNTSVHSTTGVSPFFAMYGFDPRGGDEATVPLLKPGDRRFTHHDALAKADKLRSLHEFLRRQIAIAQDIHKRYYDRRRTSPPQFKEGDLVYLDARNIRASRPSRKLSPKHLGPFPVDKVVRPDVYRLRLPPTMRIHPVFDVQLLKPVAANPYPGRVLREPEPEIVDGEEMWEVEAITDSRWFGRGRQREVRYHVRWRGFGPEYDTWEPAANVEGSGDLVSDFHTRHPSKPRPRPLP